MSHPVVLIVDSDPTACRALAESLTLEGCWTASCQRTDEAVAFLRRARRLPCLVLLGARIPEAERKAFARALDAHPSLRAVPVIALPLSGPPGADASLESEVGHALRIVREQCGKAAAVT